MGEVRPCQLPCHPVGGLVIGVIRCNRGVDTRPACRTHRRIIDRYHVFIQHPQGADRRTDLPLSSVAFGASDRLSTTRSPPLAPGYRGTSAASRQVSPRRPKKSKGNATPYLST